ncbi:3'-5' exonuclease isoform X3 [Lycium barbarum]|uniref:3'-5' exonuclease isoform X3 n=1 Tax=Lycium barbarum TaxID=112863 RepID=UPI00293F14FB|nr:3'-5' exonuclease isoform X3 [Lycium barbarum]
METPICSELNDLDRPFTEEELQQIDAAFESATKRPNNSGAGHKSRRKSRRRLPESLFVYNQQNEGSSTTPLNRCTRNRSNTSNQAAKLVMQYPEITFKGRVIYSRTTREVEKSAVELFNFVEEKKRKEGHVALGFDIEWKPTFRRGAPTGKAAVMQICGDKVGVGIANDAYKVYRDHNVFVKTSEDLSELANKKLDDPKKWGLASLTEKLLAKQLPKPSNIRLGNWEANVLSTDQLHYAATDAFVSWYLYQALKSLPEIIDDKK